MVVAGGYVGWACALDGGLFDRHVGVEVGVGAVRVGVSEPECDDGDVDPGGEEVHCRGVSQGVHRDVLAGEAGTSGSRGVEVLREAVLERIAGESLSELRGVSRTRLKDAFQAASLMFLYSASTSLGVR